MTAGSTSLRGGRSARRTSSADQSVPAPPLADGVGSFRSPATSSRTRPLMTPRPGTPASSVGGGCYDHFVAEALAHPADSLDGRLEALAAAVAMIPWPLPRERDEAACHEVVRLVDALLAMVARGHGAIDLA